MPNSLWDTYSAFANCYGGVIILGVKEDKDGNWHTTGLKNAPKLKKTFWDTLNNRKKVSINLLKDDDVETFSLNDTGDVIMVIWVPSAKREQKPAYINDNLFEGTFCRIWEGDYHCARVCLKIHSSHLHSPFCGKFAPHSVNAAHYASLIRTKSPTNCDAHLTEAIQCVSEGNWGIRHFERG